MRPLALQPCWLELSKRVADLQGMLRAQPWIHHALTERCHLVLSSCQHSKRMEERGLTLTQVIGDEAEGVRGGSSRLGA